MVKWIGKKMDSWIDRENDGQLHDDMWIDGQQGRPDGWMDNLIENIDKQRRQIIKEMDGQNGQAKSKSTIWRFPKSWGYPQIIYF